jgi:hypothetical protein
VIAFPGDMLIKNPDGEVYPCAPEIFAERWEHLGAAYAITDDMEEPPHPSIIPRGDENQVNLEPDLSAIAPETDEFDDEDEDDEVDDVLDEESDDEDVEDGEEDEDDVV